MIPLLLQLDVKCKKRLKWSLIASGTWWDSISAFFAIHIQLWMDFPFKPRELTFYRNIFSLLLFPPPSLSDPTPFVTFWSTWWVVEVLIKVVSSHPGRPETKKWWFLPHRPPNIYFFFNAMDPQYDDGRDETHNKAFFHIPPRTYIFFNSKSFSRVFPHLAWVTPNISWHFGQPDGL